MILLELTLFKFFKYFPMIFKSEVTAILLVVISNSFLSD